MAAVLIRKSVCRAAEACEPCHGGGLVQCSQGKRLPCSHAQAPTGVHLCWAHFMVIVTIHSAVAVIVIRRIMLLSVHLASKQLEERLKILHSKLSDVRKYKEMCSCLAMPCSIVLSCKACDNTCHGRICCWEYLHDFLADMSSNLDIGLAELCKLATAF